MPEDSEKKRENIIEQVSDQEMRLFIPWLQEQGRLVQERLFTKFWTYEEHHELLEKFRCQKKAS